MPQLGETVTEGTITRWMKQVGEAVNEDDVLFEVSTDKVDSEVPSPVAGVLTEILVPEGDTVDVGTRLAVISDSAAAPAPESATTAPAAGHAAEPEPDVPAESQPEPAPQPVAAEPAASPPPAAAPSPAPTPVAARNGE